MNNVTDMKVNFSKTTVEVVLTISGQQWVKEFDPNHPLFSGVGTFDAWRWYFKNNHPYTDPSVLGWSLIPS